jgi:transcriptional regulator with XRE-family HTH domain
MYEIFEKLCMAHNVTPYRVCKDTGITTASISNWKAGRYSPKVEKLQKIADYFGVTVEYLMTGKEDPKEKAPELTAKDERDIAKDLDRIMEKLTAGESGPACYNGEDLDPEAAALFKDELEIALRRLKMINKEKYTNKRYKK